MTYNNVIFNFIDDYDNTRSEGRGTVIVRDSEMMLDVLCHGYPALRDTRDRPGRILRRRS